MIRYFSTRIPLIMAVIFGVYALQRLCDLDHEWALIIVTTLNMCIILYPPECLKEKKNPWQTGWEQEARTRMGTSQYVTPRYTRGN